MLGYPRYQECIDHKLDLVLEQLILESAYLALQHSTQADFIQSCLYNPQNNLEVGFKMSAEAGPVDEVSEPPRVTISDLPNEIVSNILSFLPTTGTHYNCLLVSHRFRDLTKPLLYRNLSIPFISYNRLITLIRAIRRFPGLGNLTQTLCFGEDPYDTKRTVERILGNTDINKLWPNLRKIELFAMTFERSMLYRFFAYCSRAENLEELVLHYPDLIPLMQPIKGLKRLTWSFTTNTESPIFRTPGGEGVKESEWLQMQFLASVKRCCEGLEALRLGSANRFAQWGINDRRSLEMDEARVADDMKQLKEEIPKLANLKKFEWLAGKENFPAKYWKTVSEAVLDGSSSNLESLSWTFSMWSHDAVFLDRIDSLKSIKKLQLYMKFDDVVDGPASTIPGLVSKARLAEAMEKWHPAGLADFEVRFSVIGDNNQNEIRILKALQKAQGLRSLRMTFGRPSIKFVEGLTVEEGAPYSTIFGGNWYHDKTKMEEFLSSLPTSLESVVIDFDYEWDSAQDTPYYEFETYDELQQGSRATLAQISQLAASENPETAPRQRNTIDKAIVVKRMPRLEKMFVGWYDLVDKSEIR